MKRSLFSAAAFTLAVATGFSAEPASAVKPIPPPGIEVPDAVRTELAAGAEKLAQEIASLRTALAGNSSRLALLPDVEIFHKAVDWALRYNEFFDAKQFEVARKQLEFGLKRAQDLRDGKSSRKEETGLIIRGYRSNIDDSVQPYGLVIPETSNLAADARQRLDIWFHGRAEKLNELAFIEDRLKNRGEFAPADTIVLHLYGRYCNANKFAGEVDLFEALEDVKRTYRIDENRISVRGFSMGGAAAWQFATHFAGRWAAAAPGAGFAETAEFFKSFAPGKTPPPWWEQVLWRWYDSTVYAKNLWNVPTIAYSGETDGQIQAAEIMLRYAETEGVSFPHVIGPQFGHKYHPESKPKIEEFVTAAAAKGREEFPRKLRFTTYSLIYPELSWIKVTGLEKHWERADVDAEVQPDQITVSTSNVSGLSIRAPSSTSGKTSRQLIVDGQTIGTTGGGNGEQTNQFRKEDGKWVAGAPNSALAKSERLCGPVDHAFMSRFVMVRPTGKAMNPTIGKWVDGELEHAQSFWRKVFRGDAPLVEDNAVTEEQIRDGNLILWGDPTSNSIIAKILPKLPIQWTDEGLVVGKQRYDSAHAAPILIFPNPLNPSRYVVLNSGVTFREQALLNNSDQTPKLPDWAIVDLRTPPGPKWPGEVVNARFFDESWRLQ